MKKVPSLILLGYLVASFTCVTFAWMNAPDPEAGERAALTFDADDPNGATLRIQSKAISCSVYALDEKSDSFVNLDTLDDLFKRSNLVPGKYISLKFCFTNSSDAVAHVKLNAFDITTSDERIFDQLYFGVNEEVAPVDYYYYESIVGQNISFKDAEKGSNDKYSLTLLDDVSLVPTINDQTMDIYCYIMLSKNADSTYQDISLSLGRFRIVI